MQTSTILYISTSAILPWHTIRSSFRYFVVILPKDRQTDGMIWCDCWNKYWYFNECVIFERRSPCIGFVCFHRQHWHRSPFPFRYFSRYMARMPNHIHYCPWLITIRLHFMTYSNKMQTNVPLTFHDTNITKRPTQEARIGIGHLSQNIRNFFPTVGKKFLIFVFMSSTLWTVGNNPLLSSVWNTLRKSHSCLSNARYRPLALSQGLINRTRKINFINRFSSCPMYNYICTHAYPICLVFWHEARKPQEIIHISQWL